MSSVVSRPVSSKTSPLGCYDPHLPAPQGRASVSFAGQNLGAASGLGIYTNLSANRVALGFGGLPDLSNPLFISSETGEVSAFELVPKREKSKNGQPGKLFFSYEKKLDPAFFRAEKFALQAVSSRLLRDMPTKKGRKFRVSSCMRSVIDPKKEVSIYRSTDHGKCHFGGLMVCGSVWTCPVCASKITERRSNLIEQAVEAHKAAGGDVLLVTFTAPHTREQSLVDLLSMFKKAEEGFQKTRAVMDIKKDLNFIEPIKSLEITFGHANGWHPHSHQLWFVKSGVDPESLKNKLFPHWLNYCKKRGLEAPTLKHGLDVRNGLKASQYVSKMGWSLVKEVAKGHTKKGRAGNFAPFDLLQEYRANRSEWAKERYREYASATFGHQYISRFPKLHVLYNLDPQLTDEELASVQEEKAVLFGKVSMHHWRKVLAYDLRPAILDLCEVKNFQSVLELLEALPTPRRSWSYHAEGGAG